MKESRAWWNSLAGDPRAEELVPPGMPGGWKGQACPGSWAQAEKVLALLGGGGVRWGELVGMLRVQQTGLRVQESWGQMPG